MGLMHKLKKNINRVFTGPAVVGESEVPSGYAPPEWVSDDKPVIARIDASRDPRKLWNADAKIEFQPEPYPFYIKDNTVTELGFAQLAKYWPSRKIFAAQAGYNRVTLRMQSAQSWELFTPEQKEFWSHFIASVCPRTIRESVELFAPQIIAKHGLDIGEVQLQNFEILELFDTQLPIHVHTHHFHSPLWLGTCVYYVDDNGHTSRGTTIYRAKKGGNSTEKLSRLAASHRKIDMSDEIELAVESKFAPNRVFIMHDSPIAWHKVEDNSKLGNIGPRRHILFNWGLPFDRMQEYYGVDRKTFMDIHENQQGSRQVLDWVKKDILAVTHPAGVEEEKLNKLMKSIRIRGLGALDLF